MLSSSFSLVNLFTIDTRVLPFALGEVNFFSVENALVLSFLFSFFSFSFSFFLFAKYCTL